MLICCLQLNVDIDCPEIQFAKEEALLRFYTVGVSIVSPLAESEIGCWLYLALDPKVAFVTLALKPKPGQARLIVAFSDDTLSGETTFRTSTLGQQGVGVLDCAYTPTAIANLMDAVSAFKRVFTNKSQARPESTSKEQDKPPPQPFHFSILGLRQLRVGVENLYPTLGAFNRHGVTLGISSYSTLDGKLVNRLKLIWAVIIYLLGLDFLPSFYGVCVVIALSVTCDRASCPAEVSLCKYQASSASF